MKTPPQDLLARKRDGGSLREDEIAALVQGIATGGVADAQIGAFVMAVRIRGMTVEEVVALTRAMRDSGTILAWPGMPGPVLDKHSTGGVGDKVSLALAPIVAACGGFVPMLSGRGLGHTGGTLDKLESIPGFNVQLTDDELRRCVRDVGCAISGPGATLAPADAKLYAIRDVTATVDSLPLITASILAKKLAAGTGALVMDVKVGSGAFLPSLAEARALAASLAAVAEGAGLRCRCLLTDMNQCLGRTAGNALEVTEALTLLRAEPVDVRLSALVNALAGEMLFLGQLATTRKEAREAAARAIESGRALEIFARMVAAQGGPRDFVERPSSYLPVAPVIQPVLSAHSGYVIGIDVRRLGQAIVELGGGRFRPGEPVDARVGLADIAGLGEVVGPDRPLCVVHAADGPDAARAASAIRQCFEIADQPPDVPPLFWPMVADAADGAEGD